MANHQNHVLIIEDAPEFQLTIRASLVGDGMRFSLAGTAAEALSVCEKHKIDLITLDLTLPDMSGHELLAKLKSQSSTKNIPIIIVSGKEDITDKVMALTVGAEDYVTKPFNALELRARVDVKLRQIRQRSESSDIMVCGPVHLDLSSHRARLDVEGDVRELHLTPTEFKLLAQLAKSQDRVWTREQLLESVWGDAGEVFDRTVDAHVSTLRKKLQPYGKIIRSVSGVGYSFSPEHAKLKAS